MYLFLYSSIIKSLNAIILILYHANKNITTITNNAIFHLLEIFINIRPYLGLNIIPVELVVAAALMAVACKIIVLDLKLVSAEQVIGLVLVTIALGVKYWLIKKILF